MKVSMNEHKLQLKLVAVKYRDSIFFKDNSNPNEDKRCFISSGGNAS